MGLREFTIYATPGLTYVEDSRIAYREVVLVKREGVQFDQVESLSGSREVRHDMNMGRLYFLNEFTGPTVGRINRYTLERIFIVYK